MLRKIKSHAFLSPRKASVPAKPATSPIRVYATPSSSPVRRSYDKIRRCPDRTTCELCFENVSPSSPVGESRACGHQFHMRCVSNHTSCPLCSRISNTQRDKVSRIKRKASSWFGLTPVKQSIPDHASTPEIAARNDDDIPPIQVVQASMHGQYLCANHKSQDMLVLLKVKNTLPTVRDSQLQSTLFQRDFVLIFDCSVTQQSKSQVWRAKRTAIKLVDQLLPQDRVWALTNTEGTEEGRIVYQHRTEVVDLRQAFSEAVLHMRYGNPRATTDFEAAFGQAVKILVSLSSRNKLYVLYISDGITPIAVGVQKRVYHSTRSLGITLHTVGTGTVIDVKSLRALAHCSSTGVYLHSADNTRLVNLFLHMNRRTYLAPLTDIHMSIELYEGATLREVKDNNVNGKFTSPQTVELSIPRLGAYETCEVMLVIRLASIESALRAKKEKNDAAQSASDNLLVSRTHERLGASFRLAELEDMVKCLPSKIASLSLAYSHPLLPQSSMVQDNHHEITIKRSPGDGDEVLDDRIVELNALREIQLVILRSQKMRDTYEDTATMKQLCQAEIRIQDYLEQHNPTSSVFSDMLEFIADNRIHYATTKHNYLSKTPCAKNHHSDEIFSTFLRPRVPPKDMVGIDSISHKSPRNVSLSKPNMTRQADNVDRGHQARPRRGSTGSMLAGDRTSGYFTGLATPVEVQNQVWQKPILTRLPTSQEVHKIVRHAASKQDLNSDRSRYNPHDDPLSHFYYNQSPKVQSPSSDRVDDFIEEQQQIRHQDERDCAQRIWHSHKEERGESSMLSEDDMRVNLDNLQKEDILEGVSIDKSYIYPSDKTVADTQYAGNMSPMPLAKLKLDTFTDNKSNIKLLGMFPYIVDESPSRVVRFTASAIDLDNEDRDSRLSTVVESGNSWSANYQACSSRYSSVPDVQSPDMHIGRLLRHSSIQASPDLTLFQRHFSGFDHYSEESPEDSSDNDDMSGAVYQ